MNANCYVLLDKNVWDMNRDIDVVIKTETEGKFHSNI